MKRRPTTVDRKVKIVHFYDFIWMSMWTSNRNSTELLLSLKTMSNILRESKRPRKTHSKISFYALANNIISRETARISLFRLSVTRAQHITCVCLCLSQMLNRKLRSANDKKMKWNCIGHAQRRTVRERNDRWDTPIYHCEYFEWAVNTLTIAVNKTRQLHAMNVDDRFAYTRARICVCKTLRRMCIAKAVSRSMIFRLFTHEYIDTKANVNVRHRSRRSHTWRIRNQREMTRTTKPFDATRQRI